MTNSNVDLDDYEIPFKGIVEQSIAGIYILQDGRFQYVNETFAHMCGLKREDLVGARLCDVANPQQAAALMAQYERKIKGDGPNDQFIIRRTSARRPGFFEIHGTRVIFHGRPAIVGVGIDITEQEQQRIELIKASERLQELVSNANSVRENERTRVARELHDVIGGMLTAIKFDLTRLSWRIDNLTRSDVSGSNEGRPQPPTLSSLTATVSQILQTTQETIEAVRAISEDLRPSALDHLGLCETLSQDLNRFKERYGISTRFQTSGEVQKLERSREIGVYRIFQEALTNIARHSKATEITVSLCWNVSHLKLVIADNGLGFDVDRTGSEVHFGLLGMQERARELNGKLNLETGPRCGACVRLDVPVGANDPV